jgi:polyisoprenoid-binding protein YceI
MFQRVPRRGLFTAFLSSLGALALIAGIVTLSPAASAQESTALREIGVIAEPDGALTSLLADCTTVAALAPGELQEPEDRITSLIISGEPSVARYLVDEELAGIGANTAVGTTSAIIGQILMNGDGAPVECSRFDVDIRTLTSDSSRRDNFLYNNTLEEVYPVATFVLRTVEGLDGALSEGEETTFTLIGDLTFHGVTQVVAWEATAVSNGNELTGTAATEVLMDEFDITPPVVGSVVSVDDTIRLEVDIVAAAQ